MSVLKNVDASLAGKLKIPNSVTSIGEQTFEHCEKLTSIIIPDSVTSIGYWAFKDCSSLASIIIPDSVTNIGELNGVASLFVNCFKLPIKGIVPNTYYRIENSVLLDGFDNDNHFYQNGSLFTGIRNDKYYEDGILFTGVYNDKYYQDGILGTGIWDNKYYENGIIATPVYATVIESNGVLEATGEYKEVVNNNGTTLYLETLDMTESNGALTINSNHVREVSNEKGTTLYI